MTIRNFYIIALLIFFIASCKKETATDETPQEMLGPIIILGSSTAAGYGADPINSSWVELLMQKMKTITRDIEVINLAKSGYTTYQFLPTLTNSPANRPAVDSERNVTQAISRNPSLVIINLPSNDIANNYEDDEILNNYSLITKALDKKKVEYIITGTQPRTLKRIEDRLRLKQFNILLANIYSYKILNYFDSLSDPEYNIKGKYALGDGVHLNNQGHELIYNALISSSRFNNWLEKVTRKKIN